MEGIMAVGKDGIIRYVNPAAERILGRTVDQLLGAICGLPLVVGETCEVDLVRPDQEPRVAEVRSSEVDWGEERVYLVALHDVTERKAAEEAHRSMAELVESAGDAIIGLTLDGSIYAWNDSAERLYGFSREEAIGAPHALLVPEGYPDRLKEILHHIALGGNGENFESVRRRKDGQHICVSITISPVHDARGIVIGASKIARDITRRVLAEEALRKTHANLEEQVKQRTQQLFRVNEMLQQEVTERKLMAQNLAAQAQELARSNAELEQFAYVASHDLREPLRAITSYVGLLEADYGDRLDESGREFLGYIQEGAQRMQALVHDLLTYARVGVKRSSDELTDSNEVLNGVLFDLQIAIAESGATITHDPLPSLYIESMLLKTLLQNLLANAIKFRSEAPPRIHLSAFKEGREWHITIQDNGIGIAPKNQERIFEIFQRLHSRSKYPGTGIGLAICKKIVEQHGGKIWVESEIGKGAVFHLKFPQKLAKISGARHQKEVV
jgi:PAS domain S-box-containing protein